MPYVNAALAFAGATTCFRAAAFLALVSHFARGGTLFEELGTGEAHAGPVAATDPAFDKFEGVAALGNTLPGDGARFRARGAFRLRGRTDYAAAAFALGLDLLDDPEALALPSAALTVAAWQWGAQAGNAAADRCERARGRACERACVCVCGRACVRACGCARSAAGGRAFTFIVHVRSAVRRQASGR